MTLILLTRKETAEYLNISIPTLDRMIKSGKIKILHIGDRLIRISNEEIEKLITKEGK